MKEKEKVSPTPKEFFESELSCLKGVKSLTTVTLVTLDAAIPANAELLDRLGLEPDGWKLVTSKDVDVFLENFKEVFGSDLETFIRQRESSLRLGGSVFTTLCKLLELKPEIAEAASFVPVGKENGEKGLFDSLTKEVNGVRRRLQKELKAKLDGRLLIKETVSEGITPIILSFYQEKGRSMVLIRDEQRVMASEKVLAEILTPYLLLVDARELVQESYLGEAIRMAICPEGFLVVGLGTNSVMPEAVEKIKLLHAHARGETAFAGNKGEVEALLKNWDGARNRSGLMLKTGLRFLLETNGQNGAALYFRIGDKIHSAVYVLPREEVFEGDTTNAGDIFLAVVLAGLMDGPEEEGSVEGWLKKVLQNASRVTLGQLQERN